MILSMVLDILLYMIYTLIMIDINNKGGIMKLTKQAKAELSRVLSHLHRANEYIKKPDTVIARVSTNPTTTIHYTRAIDNTCLYSVDKEIGSDLTGLQQGLNDLLKFIATH